MMKHSLVQQRQMDHYLYLFVLFVTTTFVAFLSSPTSAFTAPQVVVRSSVRSGPAAAVVASVARSVSTASTSSSTTALYGKREKIKKKLKQMVGRRDDEAVEDDAVLLSPDVDALSNFLVDGTYSGKKRNIIKKQLKKMVKSQQSKEAEENKKAAETLDANTLHALSSLASLEQDIETLYVPISVVVDGVLSQKIDEMDQKISGGVVAKKEETPPPRKKINLNEMYKLIAEQKGKTVTYTDTETETETDIEKTATPESSSSASASTSTTASFSSSTSLPEKKIVQNVLSKLRSNKSMDVVMNDDNSTSSPTTNKMVKLSTNEQELEKLAQKYKEIEDVGERTYQMLVDLDMIGK